MVRTLINFVLFFQLLNHFSSDQEQKHSWKELDSMARSLPSHRLDSAEYYATQALELAKRDGLNGQMAKSYATLGRLNIESNNFRQAISLLNKGLEYASNDTIKADLYNALGRAYDELAKPDSAIVFILKGLEIYENFEPSYRARSFRNLGFVYRSMLEYEESLNFFKKERDIEQQFGLNDAYKRTLMNIGLLYYDMDQYDSAINYFDQSFALLDEERDAKGFAVYYNNMAASYMDMGQLEKALPYAKENLKWKKKLGDTESLAIAYNILSNLYYELNDFTRAETYASEAVMLTDTLPPSTAKLNALRCLVHAKIRVGDTTGTVGLLEKATDVSNELFEAEKTKAFAAISVQYEADRKEIENQLLKSNASSSQKTIRNQYFVILGGGILLLVLVTLIIIVWDRNKLIRSTHLQLNRQKEEMQAQKDLLEEVNRTKDRFFSIISHDLRGPVNSFQGLSALIKIYLENGQTEQISELIHAMDQSSQRLAGLLDNLLNWALTQEGAFPYNPESFELKPVILEIFNIFQSAAKAKEITVEHDIDPDFTVFADQNGIKTVLRNLLNNAIKYSKRGDRILINSTKTAESTIVSIKDTGIGISSTRLSCLFNMEKSTSLPGSAGEKGSGLGLVLCKELVDLNKGKIWAESEEGKGSTFFVELPRFRS